MVDKEEQTMFSIKRAVLNQEEFDLRYGYAEPKSGLRQIFRTRKSSSSIWRSCTKHLKQAIPIVLWLPKVTRSDLFKDIIAGFTVGVLCIPQAMAYAALANVNTVVGLYTSLFPTLVYVIFGTSKHINLGMFAVVALMTGNALEYRIETLRGNNITENIPQSHGADVELATRLIATLTFTVGFVMAIFAIMQLHFLTVYLADPIVGGFTTGAACHVFASQMPKLIGVRIPARYGPFGLLKLPYFLFDFTIALNRANVCVVIISVISIFILILGKYVINPPIQRRIRVPVPFELLVMVAGILSTYLLKLDMKQKVTVVGFIPNRLPIPAVPEFKHFVAFLVDAMLIAIVVYSFTVSVAKVFAKKHGYHIRASQELKAIALCELVGGFLNCHPASGSLSRAAVNSQLGATSELSSAVAAFLVLLVILLVGPLLYYLPMCVLASIIVVALQGMFLRVKETVRYWHASKIDLLIWLVSFLGTFLWNVSEGLAIAIAFAIATVIIRTQWPKAAILGGMKDTELYKDSRRYSAAVVTPTIAIYRYDAPLLFLNSDSFLRKALNVIDEKIKILRENERIHLIVDASGFTYIDYTGIEILKDLSQELKTRNAEILVAAPKAAARILFTTCNIYEAIPAAHFFPSIHDAVLFANAQQAEMWNAFRKQEKLKSVTRTEHENSKSTAEVLEKLMSITGEEEES